MKTKPNVMGQLALEFESLKIIIHNSKTLCINRHRTNDLFLFAFIFAQLSVINNYRNCLQFTILLFFFYKLNELV